tara:strand:- start:380 stop:613 length:234 start_codon:yes stop_codon:yes gene_type:complete
MNNVLNSKRFVVRQSLVGKNQIIEVTFKNGNSVKYNHDKVFNILTKTGLTKLPCFLKYKSYTSTTNIPKVLRDKELV